MATRSLTPEAELRPADGSSLQADPIAAASAPTAPGPRGRPLVGVVPDFRRDPLETFLVAWRRYGDVVRLPLFGGTVGHLVAHPDAIKRVMQDNYRNYTKNTPAFRALRTLVGNGLLTSQGSFWLRQRRLAQPAFHPQRLAAIGGIMTDAAAEVVQRWTGSVASGQPFDVQSEMMRLTLRVVTRALFNTNVAADVERVAQATDVTQAFVNERFYQPYPPPEWLPLPGIRRYHRARDVLDGIVYRIIEERRGSETDTGDLLSMLLLARDEETGEHMNDRQLRDEVMTLFLAGHETTAVTLTWTWYLLSTHPQVGERLRAELAAVLGGRQPTVSDLPALPYTRMVVEESLRLFPPAWAWSRMPARDDVVGGYRLPPGNPVFISPYVTHRHPGFWDNPEGFDPDRFSAERSAGRPRFAYFPFGGGPRQCIGNGFALLEARLVLATLAQHYRLELMPGHRVELLPSITLRPRYGMVMRARPAASTAA